MDYLKNHCWCSSSHWDNKHFDCQIIVSLSAYEDGYEEDWENLTQEIEVFNQKRFDEALEMAKYRIEKYPDRFTSEHLDEVKNDSETGMVTTRVFKPEVLEWLEKEIPDMKGEKAWCVGSNDYNISGSQSGLKVFMQRRKDAMLFIKTFSKWKKPIYYCQYFTDVRKTLDLETLKYKSE